MNRRGHGRGRRNRGTSRPPYESSVGDNTTASWPAPRVDDNTRPSQNHPAEEDWDAAIEAAEKQKGESRPQEKKQKQANIHAESDWAIEVEKQDTDVSRNTSAVSKNVGYSITPTREFNNSFETSTQNTSMQRWPSQEFDLVMPTFHEQKPEEQMTPREKEPANVESQVNDTKSKHEKLSSVAKWKPSPNSNKHKAKLSEPTTFAMSKTPQNDQFDSSADNFKRPQPVPGLKDLASVSAGNKPVDVSTNEKEASPERPESDEWPEMGSSTSLPRIPSQENLARSDSPLINTCGISYFLNRLRENENNQEAILKHEKTQPPSREFIQETSVVSGSRIADPSIVSMSHTGSASASRQSGSPSLQQPYPSPQQPYPSPKQPYQSSHQPYSSLQQPYQSSHQPYPSQQQPYLSPQQPYPSSQQPYPSSQHPYSSPNQSCPSVQQPYPSPQQTYSSPQQPYSSPQQPFTSQQQPYPSPGQPLPGQPNLMPTTKRAPFHEKLASMAGTHARSIDFTKQKGCKPGSVASKSTENIVPESVQKNVAMGNNGTDLISVVIDTSIPENAKMKTQEMSCSNTVNNMSVQNEVNYNPQLNPQLDVVKSNDHDKTLSKLADMSKGCRRGIDVKASQASVSQKEWTEREEDWGDNPDMGQYQKLMDSIPVITPILGQHRSFVPVQAKIEQNTEFTSDQSETHSIFTHGGYPRNAPKGFSVNVPPPGDHTSVSASGDYKTVPRCYPANVPAPGGYITIAPIPGANTTQAPIPGPYTTHAPIPGDYATHAPVPGSYTTHAQIPGTYKITAPNPGAYTTHAPIPGAYTTHGPTSSGFTANPRAPGSFQSNVPEGHQIKAAGGYISNPARDGASSRAGDQEGAHAPPSDVDVDMRSFSVTADQAVYPNGHYLTRPRDNADVHTQFKLINTPHKNTPPVVNRGDAVSRNTKYEEGVDKNQHPAQSSHLLSPRLSEVLKKIEKNGSVDLSQEGIKSNPNLNPLPVASHDLTSHQNNTVNKPMKRVTPHVAFKSNVSVCPIDVKQALPVSRSDTRAPDQSTSALLAEASAMIDVFGLDCSMPPPSMNKDRSKPPPSVPTDLAALTKNPPPLSRKETANQPRTTIATKPSLSTLTHNISERPIAAISPNTIPPLMTTPPLNTSFQSLTATTSLATVQSLASSAPVASIGAALSLPSGSVLTKPPPSLPTRDMLSSPPPPLTKPVSILKRPSDKTAATGSNQADPVRDIEKMMDQASEFATSKEKKAAPEISWSEVHPASTGQFFTNKVCLSETHNRVWIPTNLGAHTKCLDFEEVAMCSDEVEEALIVNDRPFIDMLTYLLKFSVHTRLTVFCPSPGRMEESGRSPRNTKTVPLCPLYAQHLGENGELSCDLDTCEEVREVTVIDGVAESDSKVKVMLLRTSTAVRLVTFSGSLNAVNWVKVQQFGWYYDFPLSNTGGSVATEFKSDLYNLLTSLLGENTCTNRVLQGADFTCLSRHVHLITSIQGVHEEARAEFCAKKVAALRQLCHHLTVSWRTRTSNIRNFCQTTKFGKGKAALMLGRLMDLHPDIESHRAPLKIVYPSERLVKQCLELSEGLDDRAVAPLFSNSDTHRVASPYLHQPRTDPPVIPHANIYMSWQEYTYEERMRLYGYLVTGSQVLGYGSWGDKSNTGPGCYRCSRYELAIALFPYTQDDVHHAVDLSEIGLPWTEANTEPYRDTPYTPSSKQAPAADTSLPTYIGVARRYLKIRGQRQAVFVDCLLPEHPLSRKFPEFPDNTGTAFLHDDSVRDSGLRVADVDLETVVEFRGKIRGFSNRNGKKEANFRACSVVKVHDSLQKALEAYGLTDAEGHADTAEDSPIYLGLVARSLHDKVVFIEPLPTTCSLAQKYPPFPVTSAAYLHLDTVQQFDPQAAVPEVGAVVEFRGALRHARRGRKEDVFRVAGVRHIHASAEEAAAHYGVEAREFTLPTVTSQSSGWKPWKDLSAAEQMQKKGVESDHDFDSYWRAHVPKLPEDKEKAGRLAAVNTKPVGHENDMEWLERYATARARGRLPKVLMGPFNIHVMQLRVQHSRRSFLNQEVRESKE